MFECGALSTSSFLIFGGFGGVETFGLSFLPNISNEPKNAVTDANFSEI